MSRLRDWLRRLFRRRTTRTTTPAPAPAATIVVAPGTDVARALRRARHLHHRGLTKPKGSNGRRKDCKTARELIAIAAQAACDQRMPRDEFVAQLKQAGLLGVA